MELYKQVTWFTYDDMLKGSTPADITIPELMRVYGFNDIFQESECTGELFTQLMKNIYYAYHIYYVSESDDLYAVPFVECARSFWECMYARWLNIHDRYQTLYEIYQENKANLMSKLSSLSTSDSRFNDVPENQGDYSDNGYNSTVNINKIKTETDAGTTMARIKEIENGYSDLIRDYVYEFRKLFINPNNIKEEQLW